jgi:hypothetical protein
MIRRSGLRLAMLALAAGLIAILPAGAAAKPKAKTKTTLVEEPFVLLANPDTGDGVAVCPSRTTLLGGGVLSNTPPPAAPPELDTELLKSGPIDNAWYVRLDNDANVNLLPSAQAICLKDKLKVTGADGSPKAVTKVTQVSAPFALPPDTLPTNGQAQSDVACPNGTTIAGGGAFYNASDVDALLEESGPQGNGWHVRYDNDTIDAVTGTAIALCLKSKLKIEGENEKARSKLEQVDQAVTLPPAATNAGRARFTAACPKGTTIAGGGGRIDPAAPLATTDIQLEESGVVGNGWQVTFDNDEAVAQSASVHALCLKNKLKVK